jgi:hypothetical protein
VGTSTITIELDDGVVFSYDVATENVKSQVERIVELGVRHYEGASTFRVYPPHRIRHINVGAKPLE